MEIRCWTQEREISGRSSSQQDHATRTSLFLEIRDDGYRGVGEIAPHDVAIWSDPARDEVLRYLREVLVHRLDGRRGSGSSMLHLTDSSNVARPAAALVEMALTDLSLNREGRTVEDIFAGPFSVEPQSTLSAVSGASQARVIGPARVKVSSRSTREEIAVVVADASPVILDANGDALTRELIESWTSGLRPGQLRAIEQPARPGDWNASVDFVSAGIPIYLDEAIRGVVDVRHTALYRCATGVCVKVERVGGFAMASRVISEARERGLEVYLGGFFESPWAKRWMRAFATQFELGPSDIGDGTPAARPEPAGDVSRIA